MKKFLIIALLGTALSASDTNDTERTSLASAPASATAAAAAAAASSSANVSITDRLHELTNDYGKLQIDTRSLKGFQKTFGMQYSGYSGMEETLDWVNGLTEEQWRSSFTQPEPVLQPTIESIMENLGTMHINTINLEQFRRTFSKELMRARRVHKSDSIAAQLDVTNEWVHSLTVDTFSELMLHRQAQMAHDYNQ